MVRCKSHLQYQRPKRAIGLSVDPLKSILKPGNPLLAKESGWCTFGHETAGMVFPEGFETSIHPLLGESGWKEFLQALDHPVPVSLRWNRRKTQAATSPGWEGIFQGSEIPWAPAGDYLERRPQFAQDPWWHTGAYYVQEASSMLLGHLVNYWAPPEGYHAALDLCGAPGGKSTLLRQLLGDDVLLVSNEVIKTRYPTLLENMSKWGHAGVAVSQMDPAGIRVPDGFFDLVVVDAPCSGEGLWRRDQNAIGEWSPGHVQLCASRQQRILHDAVRLLAPGGVLLYSTCTYNLTENDDNAAWLSTQFGLNILEARLPPAWGVVSRKMGYQCYPHKVKGEGFYVCGFQKPPAALPKPPKAGFRQLSPLSTDLVKRVADWGLDMEFGQLFQRKDGVIHYLPTTQIPRLELLDQGLIQKQLGLVAGQFKGKDFIPSPELALSIHLKTDSLSKVPLDIEEMRAYLRRSYEPIDPPRLGWQLMVFEGIPVGWAKGIQGGRFNNYWPVQWRLLK